MTINELINEVANYMDNHAEELIYADEEEEE